MFVCCNLPILSYENKNQPKSVCICFVGRIISHLLLLLSNENSDCDEDADDVHDDGDDGTHITQSISNIHTVHAHIKWGTQMNGKIKIIRE